VEDVARERFLRLSDKQAFHLYGRLSAPQTTETPGNHFGIPASLVQSPRRAESHIRCPHIRRNPTEFDMTRHLHGECRLTAVGSDAGSKQWLLLDADAIC